MKLIPNQGNSSNKLALMKNICQNLPNKKLGYLAWELIPGKPVLQTLEEYNAALLVEKENRGYEEPSEQEMLRLFDSHPPFDGFTESMHKIVLPLSLEHFWEAFFEGPEAPFFISQQIEDMGDKL